jgi:hypothetical protein
MTGALLSHPLSQPEPEGTEAAGDEIGGVGVELQLLRFRSTNALETSDKTLTVAKGDMVFGGRRADIGPE